MKHYHVTNNAPGCLPESDPVVVATWEDALGAVREILDSYLEFDPDDYQCEQLSAFVWHVRDETMTRVIEIQPCEENRADCKVEGI